MKNILTPYILQTIIICSTIISLAFIAVAAYRVYKKQKRDAGMYMFMSGVVVFVMVMIFSHAFYDNRNVLDFISLASALISIILAVITIVYSFYTNSRSTGQIETLNNAARSVEKATDSYSHTADSLHENIQKIISAVNRVEQKTDLILGASKATNAGNNQNFVNFDLNAYILGFINVASPLGNMLLYACIKSKDANKALQLNIIGSSETMAYCGGFLIAATSAGLVTAFIDFVNWTVSTTNYIESVKHHIDEWITRNTGNQFIVDLKDKIDKYFDSVSN